MPWNVNNGAVRLLSFDADTYQLLSNSSVGPGKEYDFGTSLVFIDDPTPANPDCVHVFLINSLPHGAGDGNGQAQLMAYEITDQGIGDHIWPKRLTLAKFTGYSPPGSSGYINSKGQLTVFFNQPVKYEANPNDKDRNNANYIGFTIS